MAHEAFTRQLDATASENELLEVVLGCHHVLRQVAHAAEKRSDQTAPVDERMLMAVLGVLSLDANLNRWLRRVQRKLSEDARSQVEPYEDLLR